MPKPLPPTRAREAKAALRRASKAAREATIAWTALRDRYKRDHWCVDDDDICPATIAMWNADKQLESCTARWREVLAERAAMPVADRWDLAALERWAVALDKAGAP